MLKRDFQHIDILLATMKAEGLKLDVTLCNTLLNLYGFRKYFYKPK